MRLPRFCYGPSCLALAGSLFVALLATLGTTADAQVESELVEKKPLELSINDAIRIALGARRPGPEDLFSVEPDLAPKE